MLQLKGRTNSSNVMKALWILDEIGLAYEREDVGGQFGKNHEAPYLSLNPNGRSRRSSTMIWCCGSRTPSCATSRRGTASGRCAPPTRPTGRAARCGWTGN